MRRSMVLSLVSLAGCLDFVGAEAQFCALRPELCADGGRDAGGIHDSGIDAGNRTDAGVDAGVFDAGLDGGDFDAGLDGGGFDAGLDAGEIDAGFDAGEFDAGFDAGLPRVCGDTRIESPEVCDDGNTTPGDGCDPTCRYFNRLTHLSGSPGTQSFADSVVGIGARYGNVTGLTTDGTSLFVADRTNRAIREVDLSTGATSTMLGGPSIEELTDGGTLRGPVDVDYHPLADGGTGAMYLADDDWQGNSGRVLRVDFFDPPGFRVARPYLSSAPGVRAVAAGYLNSFERVVTLTSSQLIQTRVLGSGSSASEASLGQTPALEGLAGSQCNDVTFVGTTSLADGGLVSKYVVTCDTALLQLTALGTSPPVTMLTGSTTAGCTDGTAVAARLTGARRLAWEGGSTAVFIDQGCNRVRRVNLITGAVSAVAGVNQSTGSISDGPNAQATFSSLSAVGAAQGFVFAAENARVRRIDGTTTRVFSGAPTRPAQVFGRDAGYIGSGGIAVDAQHVYSVVPFQQLVLRTSLVTGEAQPVTFITSDPMGRFPGPLARLGDQLYVAYANGNVRRVDLTRLPTDGSVPDGGIVDSPFWGRGMASESVTALTTDGTTLWGVTAQNRLVRFSPDGGLTPLAGAPNGMTVVDGVGVAAQLADPTALTWAAGALWFLDGAPLLGRGTVLRRYDLDGGLVTTVLGVSGDPRRVDGPGASVGDAGTARLAGGLGLAGNSTTLLIADVGRDGVQQGETQGPTLRLYDLATGQLTTAAGQPGNASFLSGTGRATLVFNPSQLAWDGVGRRFVIFDRSELVFSTFE